MRWILAVLFLSMCWTPGGDLDAQAFGAHLTMPTRYVWRGVSRVNHPTIEPGAFLVFEEARSLTSVGVWANYEPWEAGSADLSDRGFDSRGVGEVNIWLEHTRTVGELDLIAGITTYIYPGDAPNAGRTSAANTTEIYGSIQLSPRWLSPKLAAWWDVDAVDGLYLEGSVRLPVMALPQAQPTQVFAALFLGATLGVNAGQGIPANDPSAPANFQDDGVTHLDLTATINFSIPKLPAGTLTFHNQFNFDEATKRLSRSPGAVDRGSKRWLELAFRAMAL